MALNTVISNVVATILGTDSPTADIWTTGEWPEQRAAYENMWYWYHGDEWEDSVQERRDEITGEKIKNFPLQINPIAKFCRLHRAALIGMQSGLVNRAPITTRVKRVDLETDQDREDADVLERFIGRTWYGSHGMTLQHQMGLLMQIFGGHIFRIFWQPDPNFYPTSIGIQGLDTPAFFYPVAVDPMNPWHLLECYIGYEIDAVTAKLKYGITAKDKAASKVLYLEHWTESVYKITIDGTVPVVQKDGVKSPMQGENFWGVIPIVYIPHERDEGFFGRSLIVGDSTLVGLARELNARLADKGSAVQQAKALYWMSNTRGSTSKTVYISIDGIDIPIIDLGDKRPMANAGDPEIGLVQSLGMPKTVADYSTEVWKELRTQADIAAVALGDDDVSGGRITGPVTAYRMWPMMQHTMTERAFVSTAMIEIAKTIRRIAFTMQERNHELSIAITDKMMDMDFAVSWLPMIPIEQDKFEAALLNRLTAGGISLISFFRELGVSDPEAEAQAVWDEKEANAERQIKIMQAKQPQQSNFDAGRQE